MSRGKSVMIVGMTGPFETDRELLVGIRANRQDAWARLVGQYQGRLLNFAYARMTGADEAEDLVQETFTSLLSVVAKKDQDIENLEGYLYAILRNAICSLYRTRWSRSMCLIQDAFSGSDSEHSGDAMDNLPADQASVSWSYATYDYACSSNCHTRRSTCTVYKGASK